MRPYIFCGYPVPMNSLWQRLAIAAALGLLLLPIALEIQPDLNLRPLLLLWLVALATALTRLTFRLFLAGVGTVAVALTISLFTPLLPRYAQWLVVDEPPQKADLIVALGAGMHCGSGDLEASSLARVEKALELWRAGYAPRITLSDTVGEIFGDANCPSVGLEAQKQVQALYGPDSPEIILLRQMRTTRTEAQAVAQLARERGFKRILLVTAPTHSKRASLAFRKLGLEVISVVSSEPRFDMKFSKPSSYLRALQPLLREWLGLWLYKRNGWI